MRIIDAHNHPDWHGHNLEKFLQNMAQYNIDKTWLLTWGSPVEECHYSSPTVVSGPLFDSGSVMVPFDRCLSYVERCPEKFVLGYCPDPRDKNACRQLKAANTIYGAKICGECKYRTMYDSPDCIRLFRTAGELGMPVTLHFDYDMQKTMNDPWSEWWGGDMFTLERMLQMCPDTIFLGHAPGFWINISGDDLCNSTKRYPDVPQKVVEGGAIPRLLRKYPNLYCDISAGSGCRAFQRDPEFAVKFITEFQDRILYARDYFDNIHQEFLNSVNLPQSVLEKVYHGNAEKLVPGI